MAKYGHCEDCGSTMEAVGCPNCDEIDVIRQRYAFFDYGNDVRVTEDPDRALLEEYDFCPMGCGRTTEDPYGGPCSKCWEKAPR